MGRRWFALLLLLAPLPARAQSLADLGMAMSGQGGIAATSAASAEPLLRRVQGATAGATGGGWGTVGDAHASGAGNGGWATARSSTAGAPSGWASARSASPSRPAGAGWATAHGQGSTGGWARASDRTGLARR